MTAPKVTRDELVAMVRRLGALEEDDYELYCAECETEGVTHSSWCKLGALIKRLDREGLRGP